MFESGLPYLHLRGVLGADELEALKQGCMDVLERDRVPCFSLIDRLDSGPYQRVKTALEAQLGAALLLARTYFISNGRRYDMRKVAGLPTSENLALKNRCFAYSESHGDRGRFRGESQLDLKSPQSLFQDGEK